jgi:hypothetical protein
MILRFENNEKIAKLVCLLTSILSQNKTMLISGGNRYLLGVNKKLESYINLIESCGYLEIKETDEILEYII